MKRSRINPISKRDDRTMERKLDALWQKAVIARAKGRCEGPHCRSPATVAHHIVGRDNKVTRHNIDNGMAYCQKCHDWAHREPRVHQAIIHILFTYRHMVWLKRHQLLTVPYHVWMEERMKVLIS